MFGGVGTAVVVVAGVGAGWGFVRGSSRRTVGLVRLGFGLVGGGFCREDGRTDVRL